MSSLPPKDRRRKFRYEREYFKFTPLIHRYYSGGKYVHVRIIKTFYDLTTCSTRLSELENVYDPKRRWNLVNFCKRCGACMCDNHTMHIFRPKAFGEIVQEPKAKNSEARKYSESPDLCMYCKTLRDCQLCGKAGPPKVVTERSDVYAWNYEKEDWFSGIESKHLLCVGCWNKARAIAKKRSDLDEARTLIGRIQRTIANERKNQNHRATSGFLGDDDARSKERRP